MANTLRFKRGLVATIPTAVAGEPLFTTDTFDLYIGNGTTNTRFQKYIASGTTSQLLRGDGSLLTMPIVLTSPSNGQVLKYNGTNWVNDSDAGVTGSGTTNYLPKWTSGSALGNSVIQESSSLIGVNVTPTRVLHLSSSGTSSAIRLDNTVSGRPFLLLYDDSQNLTFINSSDSGYTAFNSGTGASTTKMLLTNAGNLGIGTTSPAYKLDVNGEINAVTRYRVNAGIKTNQLFGDGAAFSTSNTNDLGIRNDSGNILFASGGATVQLLLNTSGNLGLGVVPSAWSSDFKGIDIAGTSASFISSSSRNISASNTFYNGTSYIYKNSDFALMYWLDRPTGQYRWYNAPSGTAGNAITFTQAMTLGTNSGLSIGTTTAAAANGLLVAGAATFSSSVTATDLIGVDTLNITANNVNTNGTVLTLNSRGSVGVMAFQTASTERMRITSGGNVGIGNTSASAKLHVTGNILSYTEAANTASLFISANNSYNWQFGIGNNSNFVITEGGGLNAIGTERLRITTGGNLLVTGGAEITSNASTVGLKVFGGGNLNVDYLQVGYSGGSASPIFKIAYNGAATFSSSVTAASFNGATNNIFSVDGTERLRITSGGNVGIGTTSPTEKLHVVGGDVKFAANTYVGGIINAYLGDASIWVPNVGQAFTIKQNTGNVGIGTTSPAAKLHLVDSVESEIRTQYSTTSSGKLITGNGFTTIGSITNDPLVFVSNNTERMRFTNGGNLLLGSTSDTGEKFQLTGAGIVSGLFTVSGSTGIPATTATYIRFASGFASPDIGRMYIGDGSGWKFHMSKRLSSTTTDLITFFDNGSVQTSAPTGYAAKPYKLGEVLTGATTADRSIAVEIDGTVYFLLASTTLP